LAIVDLIRDREHRNDEIISWVPDGVMRHNDKATGLLLTDSKHLIVKNAGRSFWHSEETLSSDRLCACFRSSCGRVPRIPIPDSAWTDTTAEAEHLAAPGQTGTKRRTLPRLQYSEEMETTAQL
jgi:redox-sensitive bicupin YhaK (pirin superfamily)